MIDEPDPTATDRVDSITKPSRSLSPANVGGGVTAFLSWS